jgi:hypothetical protein
MTAAAAPADPRASIRRRAAAHGSRREAFRWLLNEDAMATEKLAEGIRAFAKDLRALHELMSRKHRSGELRAGGRPIWPKASRSPTTRKPCCS